MAESTDRATAPADSPTTSRFGHLSRPLVIIVFTIFLNLTGLGLIIPILPFYATSFGATGAQVGLLFTTYAGLQFLTAPVLGRLSDRFGRRPVILFGLLGSVGGYVLMGLAGSLTVLFLSRALAGATSGNIAAGQAYIADITAPKERTRAFGLVGAAFGAGFLFGPALGGLLTLVGPKAPAFGAAILVAANLAFAFFYLPESLPPARRSTEKVRRQLNPFGPLVQLWSRPLLRAPLATNFLVNFALTGYQTNFAVFAGTKFGYGPRDVAQLFVVLATVNILAQLLMVPKLAQRMSDVSLAVVGMGAIAIAYLITGFTPSSAALWFSAPLLSVGNALSRPPMTSLVTKLVGDREQGLANGGSQAAISLASITGPIWAGFLYVSVASFGPYLSSAVAVLLAAALLWVVRNATTKASTSSAGASSADTSPHAVSPDSG